MSCLRHVKAKTHLLLFAHFEVVQRAARCLDGWGLGKFDRVVIVAFYGRQRLEEAQRVGRPPLKRPERFGHTGLSLDLANRRRLALLGRLLLQPASQIGERPFRPRVGQGIDGGAESRLELVAALGDVCVPLASRASDARRSSKVPESAPPGVSPDGATSGT